MFFKVVFSSSHISGKRLRSTKHLENKDHNNLYYVGYLEHIPSEVLFFVFVLSESFQNLLAEVRKINQPVPRNFKIPVVSRRHRKLYNIRLLSILIIIRLYICHMSYLAIWFGMSTTSCSDGFNPSICMAF